MKLGFFVKEALRSMRRNAVPSFAAVATVLVTVLVLGVFIPIVQATTGAASEVRNRVIANVYLQTDATAADAARVRALIESTPNVQSIEFISKAQALEEQKEEYSAAYELLGSNPLPDTFRVTPEDPDDILAVRNALAPLPASGGARVPVDRAIDEVSNREDNTDKILTLTKVVKYAAAGLAGLLAIASILLIANTIRLSLYSRRREVEVMKLVGATDWFIRWPFVLEGILLGAVGGVFAIAMLGAIKFTLLDSFSGDFALISAPETLNFGVLVIVLLGASVLVSALGSGLSLRRFLRV